MLVKARRSGRSDHEPVDTITTCLLESLKWHKVPPTRAATSELQIYLLTIIMNTYYFLKNSTDHAQAAYCLHQNLPHLLMPLCGQMNYMIETYLNTVK